MDATSHDVTIREEIREMVRRIVKQCAPEKVVLFGSYARGTAGPDSDVDLMVVMHVVGSRRRERLRIRQALHAMGLPKDVVVATPDEVERFRDVPGSLIAPALREGQVLYERPR